MNYATSQNTPHGKDELLDKDKVVLATTILQEISHHSRDFERKLLLESKEVERQLRVKLEKVEQESKEVERKLLRESKEVERQLRFKLEKVEQESKEVERKLRSKLEKVEQESKEVERKLRSKLEKVELDLKENGRFLWSKLKEVEQESKEVEGELRSKLEKVELEKGLLVKDVDFNRRFRLIIAIRSRIEYLEKILIPDGYKFKQTTTRKDKWFAILTCSDNKFISNSNIMGFREIFRGLKMNVKSFVETLMFLYGEFSDNVTHNEPLPKVITNTLIIEILDQVGIIEDETGYKVVRLLLTPIHHPKKPVCSQIKYQTARNGHSYKTYRRNRYQSRTRRY